MASVIGARRAGYQNEWLSNFGGKTSVTMFRTKSNSTDTKVLNSLWGAISNVKQVNESKLHGFFAKMNRSNSFGINRLTKKPGGRGGFFSRRHFATDICEAQVIDFGGGRISPQNLTFPRQNHAGNSGSYCSTRVVRKLTG